jgi:RNA-dependent RNA polymerase
VDVVTKHVARMGQCFSSTYCTVEVPLKQVEDLPDIKRNGYEFSDWYRKNYTGSCHGSCSKLQLNFNSPSAFQIRYGGYKGVIATWATKPISKFRLSLRPSMKTFESEHTMLEIDYLDMFPALLFEQGNNYFAFILVGA